MLRFKYNIEDLRHSLLRRAFVQYLIVPLLVGEVIYLMVNSLDALAVQFLLALQDSVGRSREEYIVVKRGDKAFAEIIKEAGGQIDAAAAAVADDIRVVAVE